MEKKVEVEWDVRRQKQVKRVVGVKRQCVGVACQRLAAPVRQVPPRDRTGAPGGGGDDLHRVVGREVVAEEEKAEEGHDRPNGTLQESDDVASPPNARRAPPAPALI